VNRSAPVLKRAALIAYFGLIVLVLLWEGWLAPAPNAPPGIWLILKAVPLLVPLRGLLKGRKRTYLLTTLLLMLYFIDGVVLTWLHWGQGFAFNRPLLYAIVEWVLATACFTLALMYIRKAGNSE